MKEEEEMVPEEPKENHLKNRSWSTIIASAIFVSGPSIIPFYYGVTLEEGSAKIIFIAVGFMVVITNILILLYMIRMLRRT